MRGDPYAAVLYLIQQPEARPLCAPERGYTAGFYFWVPRLANFRGNASWTPVTFPGFTGWVADGGCTRDTRSRGSLRLKTYPTIHSLSGYSEYIR